MKRLNAIFLMVCCALCAVPAWSQHTVKGIIKDKENAPRYRCKRNNTLFARYI